MRITSLEKIFLAKYQLPSLIAGILEGIDVEVLPNHRTDPSSNTAHVCFRPAEISVALAGRSRNGKLFPISLLVSPRELEFPRPSCPLSLKPQHLILPMANNAQ
eukprot:766017-Hanusia_phi.AAC.1